MPRQPIVWVIKEQVRRGITGVEAMDYTPAMKYGELRFITDADIPHHPGSSVYKEWQRKVEAFCTEYDENKDFIVCTGQPVAMVQIGYMLGSHEQFPKNPRYLVYRREDNAYQPLLIN